MSNDEIIVYYENILCITIEHKETKTANGVISYTWYVRCVWYMSLNDCILIDYLLRKLYVLSMNEKKQKTQLIVLFHKHRCFCKVTLGKWLNDHMLWYVKISNALPMNKLKQKQLIVLYYSHDMYNVLARCHLTIECS